MQKSISFFVFDAFPDDDFTLELDAKSFSQPVADKSFIEKLEELPKLRLKVKDFLAFHFKKYPGDKMDFLAHLENLLTGNLPSKDKISEWVTEQKEVLILIKDKNTFKPSFESKEVPIKWAKSDDDLSVWLNKNVREGNIVVKNMASAEQFLKDLLL